MRNAFHLVLVLGLIGVGPGPVISSTAPLKHRAEPSRDPAAVIGGALKFLASRQHADGSWSLSDGGSPVGITGYTLIAFLSAGHRPGQGEYGKPLSRAAGFLASCVRDDGLVYSQAPGRWPHNLYDQGIATFALAQLYALTQEPALPPKLRKAVALIARAQDDSGGWRYKPIAAERPDLPITASQLCALCAARSAGIDVPQRTIDRGVAYLLRCRDQKTGGFAYTPTGSRPGFSRTASAICALRLCGKGDDTVRKGSEYLFLPRTQTERDEQGLWFAYGRYYAAAAQSLAGGETWQRWYATVRADLVREAKREGDMTHWEDAQSNPPDAVYVTALNVTILALPGHHLPAYEPKKR